MKHLFRLVIISFLLTGFLLGCSEEPSSSAPVATSKPPKKQVKPPAAAEKDKPKAPAEEKFKYKVDGRRDPFVALTEKLKPESDEPQTPLQQYDLAQYRLIGVIIGVGKPRAMVVAPDKKSYILTEGTKIGKNNGVVIEVTEEVILVEETFTDFSGNVRTNIAEVVVPKREGV